MRRTGSKKAAQRFSAAFAGLKACATPVLAPCRVVLAIVLLLPVVAAAQSRERVSVDTVAAIDLFKGQAATDRPNAILDVGLAVRLGDGWLAYVRP